MTPEQTQPMLATLGKMERRLSSAFRDSAAGQDMHAAAGELRDAYWLIERAAKRFGIEANWRDIEQEGRAAFVTGVPWYNNPYPSGSWQAATWDAGLMEMHKIQAKGI